MRVNFFLDYIKFRYGSDKLDYGQPGLLYLFQTVEFDMDRQDFQYIFLTLE